MRASDLVICGTDNRQSKLLINELCVVGKCHGGLRRCLPPRLWRPNSACPPEAFAMPAVFCGRDARRSLGCRGIIADDASEIAYSDRPVAVEPGLSLDVLPIANMLAKLALLELLADKSSTLNMLRRDFDAPWYLWLNRPEPGTQYADWPPLSESSDEMTINRWYGIYFDRDERLPRLRRFSCELRGVLRPRSVASFRRSRTRSDALELSGDFARYVSSLEPDETPSPQQRTRTRKSGIAED